MSGHFYFVLRKVHLHADNCVGQNKNNYVMQVNLTANKLYIRVYKFTNNTRTFVLCQQYLLWRVLVSLHEEITISFLPVGHTKFAPDWCFGLLKRKFRKSVVNCLDDFVKVVETSAEVNTYQLVGTQSGEVLVPTYNWAGYFQETMRKLPHIKKYHHFNFSHINHGSIAVKEASTDSWQLISILKPSIHLLPSSLPEVIKPSGLSLERQLYLYQQIRPFCSSETQDIVCPQPISDLPAATEWINPLTITEEQPEPPPPKRQRLCGLCHKPGHNRATCGGQTSE